MNSRYTKHVATILTFVFMAILYSGVLKKLALDWWNDPNYSHGFLIPFISIYWIWGRRKFLRAAQTDISAWGLPVLFASGILYIVGHITGELFTQRFSFVIRTLICQQAFSIHFQEKLFFWRESYCSLELRC